jgi:glycosyltransferase involved in cell wall biosynthesis
VFDSFSKEDISFKYGVPPSKISVIPIGDYTSVLTDMRVKNESTLDGSVHKYVLFLGRIVAYNGLEYLIKAEPAIRKEIPDAKIIIAGSCDDFSHYESLMVNKDSFVVYNCWVEDKRISYLFSKADVVVLPYIEYSKSDNIQLAYAFKKPVVASRLGSISEYVFDGKTGFLIPPMDSEALANAIIKILKNTDLAKDMGENGFRLMREGFISWPNIVSEAMVIYATVANNDL